MATNVTIATNNASTNYTLSTGARGPVGPNAVTSATTSDGTAELYLDSIRFETSNGGPTQLGEMAWESNDGSIDAQLENGVIAALGEDGLIRVRNTSGVPIAKGDALRFIGTAGGSGRLEVGKWVGANVSNVKTFMGFAACAMTHNSNGYAQWFGKLEGINASGGGEAWTDGQIIYAVPGASAVITDIAPTDAGEYVVAAAVINAGSGTSGSLFVRPSFSKNIAIADVDDLEDALDAKLGIQSQLVITGTTPALTEPLVEDVTGSFSGYRAWSNSEGWQLFYGGSYWELFKDLEYSATAGPTSSKEPWDGLSWTVNEGIGAPAFNINVLRLDNSTIVGQLPLAYGGTGGTNAATARTNLKVPASDPTGVSGADAIVNIISLTQAEYDAIATPSATTLYVIV